MTDDERCRLAGWLVRDKGLDYLASGRGWFELEDLPRGHRTRTSVLVDGVKTGPATLRVTSVVADRRDPAGFTGDPADSAGEGRRRPYYAGTPMPQLVAGSALRQVVHTWARERDILEVSLPTVWSRSEEYGREEYSVRHSGCTELDLKLLQSCEFPLYTALAEGLDRIFTFGRCYRYEDGHRAEDDANYLSEFDQLVLGLSFVDLTAAMTIVQELISALADAVGVPLDPADFRVVAPPGISEVSTGHDLSMESSAFFTFPSTWSTTGREAVVRQLRAVEASVVRMDGTDNGPVAGELGETVPIAVESGPDARDRVRRILDIASSYVMPATDVKQAVVRQWNPTWNAFPPLEWQPDERVDSAYPIRSLASRRETDANGVARVADAELYLGGVEVAHLRAFADRAQFAENLVLAGIADGPARYRYILNSLAGAPPDLTGVFIGWERLVASLTGLPGAADVLPLPRNGRGRLMRPCGPSEQLARRRKGHHALG